MKKQTLGVILLIILAMLPAVRALAIPGFYTSHDGVTHTARIANFSLALAEGQIPPRLAPKLFGGFGFPIFIFIYPLPYLLGSLIHAAGIPFTDSFEIVIGTSFLISALTMFFFIKELFGLWPAFISALFYTWAPYRLSQIYVRGAVAENFAYLFVPIVLLSLLRLSKKPELKWTTVGSLSFAGMLLSHQLVSLMFLPVFACFGLVFLFQSNDKKSYIRHAFFMTLLGLFTSAYIYVPALFERSFLHFDELMNYYSDHFVTLKQLMHSPWSYGFSMPGTLADDMSFQIGLTHLLVVAVSAIFFAWLFVKNKKKIWKDASNRIGLVSLVIFTISVILMLDYPVVRAIWKYTPALSMLDFPWRLLGVSVFASSMLVAYLTRVLKNKLIFFVFLFFVFFANRNHLRINQTFLLDDAYFLTYDQTATWRNEFLPIWRITNKLQNLERVVRVRKGDVLIESSQVKTLKLMLRTQSEVGGKIVIPRLYFPGWTVRIDGQLQKLNESFKITNNVDIQPESRPNVDDSGLIEVSVPKGRHEIEVIFSETPIRKLGFIFSIAGVVTTLGLILEGRIRAIVQAPKTMRRRRGT